LALVLAAGCASTQITGRQEYQGGKIPRPADIWVYDFAATPEEVPSDAPISAAAVDHSTSQTPEQIAVGRELGSQIAKQLVQEILSMGLSARRASDFSKPQVNDLVLRGYLVSIDEGSATKRVTIGFGSGASHLTTTVEGFQVTNQGLRKLGSGTLESGGGKTPGGAVGVAGLIITGNPVGLVVSGGMKAYGELSGSAKLEGRAKATAKEIADQIKPKFQQQGWIP